MGKLDINPIVTHFSHPHPLKPINSQTQNTNSITCSNCKLEALGWMYTCTTCNFFLHKACSTMPQQMNHRFDPSHTLTLLSSPAYPEGAFKCNACGLVGSGFCYHCKDCQIDIHTLCAFMPYSVTTKAHHHTLNLCFSRPYENNGFRCDICKSSGSNHWLFRCGTCEFDTHLNCAMANVVMQVSQHQLVNSRSIRVDGNSSFYQNTNLMQPQYLNPNNGPCLHGNGFEMNGYGAQPARTNTMGNDAVGNLVQGIVGGVAQQAGLAILQGLFGNF